MHPNRLHVYHPFKNSSFGFFPIDSKYQAQSDNGIFVEDIDLYYQPLPSPINAGLFFLARAIMVTIGEFIHIKVYKMIEKEKGLVHDLSTLYLRFQMFYVPFWLIFTTCTDFIHPLNEVIGQWFCSIGWVIIYFCATLLAIHSFIVALIRYFFILYRKQMEAIGKEKVKRFFFILHLLVPLMMVLWTGIEGSETEWFSFLNKCYGKDHKRFLTDLAPPDVFKRSFCMLENYDYTGPFGDMVGVIRRISCAASKIIYVVMGSNLIEGILYFKILSNLNR